MSDPASDRGIHPWVAEAADRVRFGVVVHGSSWSAVRDRAQAAEALGFDSCWVPDHPVAFGYDPWTRLIALASVTRSVRLGPLVSCVYYRHAAALARQACDVDEVSGGRLVLGLGIGDAPPEFAQLGLAFPPVGARQRALEETLAVVPRLLAGETVTHAGEHVRVEGARLLAPAVQRPYVPVLLAGGGEKVTLRQVGRYADASNFGPNSVTGGAWTVEDVRRKYAVLDAHCADAGRPPSSVLRTFANFGFRLVTDGTAQPRREQWTGAFAGVENQVFAGTPGQAIAYFRDLVSAGVQYFIVAPSGDPLVTMRLLAEQVVPAVTKP